VPSYIKLKNSLILLIVSEEIISSSPDVNTSSIVRPIFFKESSKAFTYCLYLFKSSILPTLMSSAASLNLSKIGLKVE
jgi:hypothetical protein